MFRAIVVGKLGAFALSVAWFVGLCVLAACGGSSAPKSDDAAVRDAEASDDAARPEEDAALPKDAGSDDASVGDCPPLAPNALPQTLSCTGLYSDIARKTLADGVRGFAPAYALWSDGAQKARFVWLPEGAKIDASDAAEWEFPAGTKFWKEFQHKGQRVETRLFWKTASGTWIKTSYHWDDDELDAERFAGGDVQVGGDTYYIPSGKECDQCHKGRSDRALGFEAALLGLPGATGITLADLIDEGLIEGNTLPATLALGDDATGEAGPALAWLHVNCGVSCHNGNSASEAYKTELRLRLDPRQLDGRAVDGFDALTTAIGVAARTPAWSGQTRIVAGDPDHSLLVALIKTRTEDMRDQMPPIASRVVDSEGVALIETWVSALGGGGGDDAGVP